MRQGDRLYTLDGLRGIAAIIVMLTHLRPAVDIAPEGYLAVDFFFVLSGVVIAENYGARLRDGMGWGAFLRLRYIRLYPLYAVGIVLGLMRALTRVALHQPTTIPLGQIGIAFMFGLLMLPAPSSVPSIYPLLVPAWSLMFELVANALYAAGLMRRRAGALVLAIAAAAGLWFLRDGVAGLDLGGAWHELHVGLLRVTCSFFAGVALYEFALRDSRPVGTPLALVPIGICAALMIAEVSAPMRGTYDWLCITIAFPGLVWLGARWNAPELLRAPFSWLGAVSYPLYTIHYPLIFIATFLAPKLGVPPIIWIPALTCVLLALSTALAWRFDGPARKWLGQVLSMKTRAQA